MRPKLLVFCSFLSFLNVLSAQSGCPGCLVSLPAGLPDDTLFLQPIPDGQQGVPYDADISFRVPKSTTPVNAVDSTTPPGLPISKIEIVSVDGLPYGLSWQANQTVFETATLTDGCIKICGTPYQKDTFILTVKLKATVFIFTQEASFPMRMYIAPKVSTTDGFTMTDFTGCGSATVSFTNNIPSGGNAGFTYDWNFGDSTTSTAENPPPHTYTKPGSYPVSFHATIDTSGYKLLTAKVLSVDACTDQAGLGQPDLYMFILDANGMEVYNSSPEINNTVLPHTFPVDITLGTGSYRLELWDEDSGLEGSDDPCGVVYFNRLNDGDTIVSGNLKVVLTIAHQVEEVQSADTVIVYPLPVQPKVMANAVKACAGTESIVLESSYGAGNQWLRNGAIISGASEFLYVPKESGYYQTEISTVFGCSAVSDSLWIEFYSLPAIPKYINDRNNLEANTAVLPDSFALQWYLFAQPIDSATGITYCAQVNGDYTLVVTDLNTGCTNSFTSSVVINPAFDCTVGTHDIALAGWTIFPNPASDRITVQLAEPLAFNSELRVWDVAGRLVQHLPVGSGASQIQLDASALDQGWYALELNVGGKRLLGQLAIVR